MRVKAAKKVSSHLLLILFGVIWVIPFVWMAVSSFKSAVEIIAGASWIPQHPTFANYQEVWQSAQFPALYLNTVWIVAVTLLAQLTLGIFAAYAFARRKFPGADLLFLLAMIQLFIPV